MFWTIEDLNAGLCGVENLGNPKPESEAVTAPAAPIDLTGKSLRERLRDDALQAYHELGGVEYLKKNPELLDKILAKTFMPEPTPTTVNVGLGVGYTLPEWISARRLMYKEALEVAEDIKVKDEADALKSMDELPPKLQQEVEAYRAEVRAKGSPLPLPRNSKTTRP